MKPQKSSRCESLMQGRIGKTLENTSEIHKIIHKVMTSFTGFSKLKEEKVEKLQLQFPLYTSNSHTPSFQLSSRSPVPLTAHKRLDIKTKLSTVKNSPS